MTYRGRLAPLLIAAAQQAHSATAKVQASLDGDRAAFCSLTASLLRGQRG